MKATKLSKTAQKWLDRVRDNQTYWTEKEIIYFRKYLNNISDRDDLNQWFRIFGKFVTNRGYQLRQSHQSKGTNYMLGKALKADGTKRKNCKLSDNDIRILQNPTVEHRFMDLKVVTGNIYPVYRAITLSGEYFDYTGVTNDLMEIVGTNYICDDRAPTATVYKPLYAIDGGKPFSLKDVMQSRESRNKKLAKKYQNKKVR